MAAPGALPEVRWEAALGPWLRRTLLRWLQRAAVAEAVSVSAVRDGIHAAAGHPLPGLLGTVASDPGSPAVPAERRSPGVAGEPATAAVLAAGAAPTAVAGGVDPGEPARSRCGQRAEGAGSAADHRQYAFGELPPGTASGCRPRVAVGGAGGGLCGSLRWRREHNGQRLAEACEHQPRGALITVLVAGCARRSGQVRGEQCRRTPPQCSRGTVSPPAPLPVGARWGG